MDKTNTPNTLSPQNPASLRPRTRMVHAGTARSGFDETCEAIFMTSGFVYGTAEEAESAFANDGSRFCLLYTSPSPRDGLLSRMPSSA